MKTLSACHHNGRRPSNCARASSRARPRGRDADDLAKNRMPHEDFLARRRGPRLLRRDFRVVLFLRLERLSLSLSLALVSVSKMDRFTRDQLVERNPDGSRSTLGPRRPQGRGLVPAIAACSWSRESVASASSWRRAAAAAGPLILEEIGLASPLPPTLSPRLWLFGLWIPAIYPASFLPNRWKAIHHTPATTGLLRTLLLDLREAQFLPLLQCKINRGRVTSDVSFNRSS